MAIYNGQDLRGLTIYNKNEIILPHHQIKKLEGIKMSHTPTKYSYENAKETIRKYEERQIQLKGLEKELSKKIQLFQSVNFRVDKKKGVVIFAGSKDGKTLIGTSQCNDNDIFELVIGKLVAIKKSLKEDIENVVKLTEEKGTFTLTGIQINLGDRLSCSSIVDSAHSSWIDTRTQLG